ncbi:MAG TPA: hypothetical protein VG367_20375 [Mucilaginibacter sp.]|jgi:hypothetical protein|nr:hypothetical protein [Mucilaginibacter sp.]
MKPKTIIIEITILLVIALCTLLVMYYLTGLKHLNESVLEAEIHSSYFVFARSTLWIPLFLLIASLTYLLKEAFYRYKRRLPNLILLICLLLFNLELLSFLKFIASLHHFGRTIYPPLSAIPKESPDVSDYKETVMQVLFFLQILFLILLVIVSILTGKNWNLKDDKALLS